MLLCLFASPALALETIKRFGADIRMRSDAALDVTETIAVNVEWNQIRHGIMRSFPVVCKENGHTRRAGFEVTHVLLDGQPVRYSLESDGAYKTVRIGDRGSYVSRGLHIYTLAYRTTGQLRFFADHDELYWNVTGDRWGFPIESAVCRVCLPDRAPGQDLRTTEWYVGRYGEKGAPGDAASDAAGEVRTLRTLSPGEGLTVVCTWDKGIVAMPRSGNGLWAQLAIAAVTLLLTLLWYWFAWKLWGDDPEGKPVTPLFRPPHGESPARLRFYRDVNVDGTSFAAALLDLAVKGALRIISTGGGGLLDKRKYTLVSKKFTPPELPEEEAQLLKKLFLLGDTLPLDDKHSANLRLAMEALETPLYAEKERLFANHALLCLPALIIFLTGVFVCFMAGADPQLSLLTACGGVMLSLYGTFSGYGGKKEGFVRRGVNIAGIVYLVLTMIRLFGLLGRAGSGILVIPVLLFFVCFSVLLVPKFFLRGSKVASTDGELVKLLSVRLLPAALLTACAAFAIWLRLYENPLPFALFMAAAAAAIPMKPLLAARSKEGADAASDALGLQMYLNTAERHRLEMFNPPEDTPEIFEKLLPYAFALDAAETWADRFAQVLERSCYEPDWCDGGGRPFFYSPHGMSDFSGGLSGAVSRGMTPPASSGGSGSGGGGFSGGGGGGGGGGGW